jgi:hypothetical protein
MPEEDVFTLDANTDEELREYNLPLYGCHGQFSLTPGVTVPYFSTLMPINRITLELKTHEEVAPSLDNRYTLEELFQRQIDINRVRSEIVDGYLKAHNKLKFFNSITVALFPKKQSGNILPNFEDYPNNNPRIPVEGAGRFDESFASSSLERIVFGGVQFVKAPAANLARLRWDRQRVDAVAVDGQHRLIALKEWFRDKKQELTDIEKPTRIPVIFLLLHERAGFERNTNDDSVSIKGIAREIFTDLNKNAKEVDLATQIILDDRSLESRCVRSLVTASTCEDSDKLLPLSLLRWREANNRFDQKHFLNSLVNLHLIVKDLLGLQLPNDPMNAKEVRRYINNLETCLGEEINGRKSLVADNKNLIEVYNSDYFDADVDDPDSPIRPFIGIPPAFLPSALAGFEKNFAPWMLAILRDFKPYKEILEYARRNNLIEGRFSQFLSQPESARVELMKTLEAERGDNWHEQIIGRHQREIQNIKGTGDTILGEHWAFKTIFQKAILRLAKRFKLMTPDEIQRFGTVETLIKFLDNLCDRGMLRVLYTEKELRYHYWTFIAINYGNLRIRVSATTEKQIEEFLLIIYTGIRYAQYKEMAISISPGDGLITPRTIFNEISSKKSHVEWRAHDAIEMILDLLIRNASVIDSGLREKEQDGSLTGDALERKKKEVARDYLINLLSICWVPQDRTLIMRSEKDDDVFI